MKCLLLEYKMVYNGTDKLFYFLSLSVHLHQCSSMLNNGSKMNHFLIGQFVFFVLTGSYGWQKLSWFSNDLIEIWKRLCLDDNSDNHTCGKPLLILKLIISYGFNKSNMSYGSDKQI